MTHTHIIMWCVIMKRKGFWTLPNSDQRHHDFVPASAACSAKAWYIAQTFTPQTTWVGFKGFTSNLATQSPNENAQWLLSFVHVDIVISWLRGLLINFRLLLVEFPHETGQKPTKTTGASLMLNCPTPCLTIERTWKRPKVEVQNEMYDHYSPQKLRGRKQVAVGQKKLQS